MGQNQDFRAVYLSETIKMQREQEERRGRWILVIVAGVIIGLGGGALSIASGLEDARRIATERELY